MIERTPPAAYVAPSRVLIGGTIGQHVRHALDHFTAALTGTRGDVIDYDHRERDTPIERDPRAALALIADLAQSIEALSGEAATSAVRIRVMLSGAGDEHVLGSTLERELAFAQHHAIHHHAMMAAIAREVGLEVPEGFGKAPSTLHHEAGRLSEAKPACGCGHSGGCGAPR